MQLQQAWPEKDRLNGHIYQEGLWGTFHPISWLGGFFP